MFWSSSCWDLDSQLFLRKYDVSFNKIASPMITNLPLLEMVAEEGKKTFLSTGMSTWEEIDSAVDIFIKHNCEIVILHCVSTYPADNNISNLLMIPELNKRYNVPVGFSDHSRGRLMSTSAVAMGAIAIERHVTTDKTQYGSDQAASLEIEDFKRLVVDIRGITEALGTGERILSPAELEVRKKLRGV